MSKRVLDLETGKFTTYTGKSCAKSLQEAGHPNFQKPVKALNPAHPTFAMVSNEEKEEVTALGLESLSDEELDAELSKRKAIQSAKAAKKLAAKEEAATAKEGGSLGGLTLEELSKMPVAAIKGLLVEKKVDFSRIPASPKKLFVDFAAPHLVKSEPDDL